MNARLIPPSGDFTGNLLWSVAQLTGKEAPLEASLALIRAVGYWVSPYPEDALQYQGQVLDRAQLLEAIVAATIN